MRRHVGRHRPPRRPVVEGPLAPWNGTAEDVARAFDVPLDMLGSSVPTPPRRPVTDVELMVEHVGIALRHLGAFEPAGVPGPWDDARTVDDAWALADIDLADMRAAVAS